MLMMQTVVCGFYRTRKFLQWDQDKEIESFSWFHFLFSDVKVRLNIMKEKYITITGMNHYYGLRPFSVGKKVKCIKDKNNAYDLSLIHI